MPLKVKIGDDIFSLATNVDLAVHPDFRGMGLSRKIRALSNNMRVQAGIKTSYFITGNPILIKSLSKRDPRFPFHIVNLVRIKNIKRHFREMPVKNTWLMKLGYRLLKLMNKISYSSNPFRTADCKIRISDIDHFDKDIDDFWEEVSKHYDFIIERKRDYLNWRYCDTRAGDFVVKQAEEDGRILGYVVLRINRYLTTSMSGIPVIMDAVA